jgi:guanylate kinase
VSAPSGAGKTSVVWGLLDRDPDLSLSVSVTTRPPRPDERDGIAYRFVSDAAFARLEAEGAFLETAVVHGARYGTPRDQVEPAIAAGKTVVLEIDVQGARQVRAAMPEVVTVFIEPPSMQVLAQRLSARMTEAPEDLARRLANAEAEMIAAGEFDHRIVNEVLEDAVDALARILEGTPRTRSNP